MVCSAKVAQTSEKVAIKKIGNAFENLTDARRTLREIKLLRHLKHENVIAVKVRWAGTCARRWVQPGHKAYERASCNRESLAWLLQDILKPPTKDAFNDVYLVYELMDTDLHQIIRSSQPLTNEHFQYFVYQVSRACARR